MRIALDRTYLFRGRYYGPGTAVEVPADFPLMRGSQASSEEEPQGAEGTETGTGTELPEDFPARDLLVEAGFLTLEAVAAASDDELRAVNGVGPATVSQIRDALG